MNQTTETNIYFAVNNGGEWHHVAEDWYDLGTLQGDEIEAGQCQECGSWMKCAWDDAGAEPVDHTQPELGYSRQAEMVLTSEKYAHCKGCGRAFEVQEIQWCCDGSREWHITDPDLFIEGPEVG